MSLYLRGGWFILFSLMIGIPKMYAGDPPGLLEAGSSYFPVKQHFTWEYEVAEEGKTAMQTVVCEVLPSSSAEKVLFELRNSGPRNSIYQYQLTRDTIFHLTTIIEYGYSMFEYHLTNQPGIPIFINSLQPGQAWTSDGLVESSLINWNVHAEFRVLTPETLETAAGTFQCIRLQIDIQQDSRRESLVAWYAKGVGLVKVVSEKYTKQLIRYHS